MNENQEIKPTSKSHLKALVKRGREKAQKDAEADKRDAAERAVRRRQRQGSNYDPSEDDLEEMKMNPVDAVKKLQQMKKDDPKGYAKIQLKKGTTYPSPRAMADSYDPTAEFADRVMREAFDRMTKGELKDYDSKSKKPGSQLGHRRASTRAEREEMAAKFQKSRGGAGEKVKKLRDLRKP